MKLRLFLLSGLSVLAASASASELVPLGHRMKAPLVPRSSHTLQVTVGGAIDALDVIQVTMSSGTVVEEYLNANGVVVAIAWSGPQMPDMASLLDSRFASMTPRGSLDPDLVVSSRGHMHAFHGVAYLKSLVAAATQPATSQR